MRRVKVISIIVIVLLVVVVAYGFDPVYLSNRFGTIVNPGQLHTSKKAWVAIDATTSADAQPDDLAVDERTYLTVVAAIAAQSATPSAGDGEISIYGDDAAERRIMESWNSVKFRNIGITNSGTVTYQIYLGTLEVGGTDCELVKAGQLAFVIGQQVSITASYLMADAVTVTNYCWSSSWATASPSGDLCAEARIDLLEANIIVAVCTVASCDTKLLATGAF